MFKVGDMVLNTHNISCPYGNDYKNKKGKVVYVDNDDQVLVHFITPIHPEVSNRDIAYWHENIPRDTWWVPIYQLRKASILS